MNIPEKDLFAEDEAGYDTTQYIGHIQPASAESVVTVLNAGTEGPNGRSGWMWVRLQTGDLILGVFPQGDTYFATELDHATPSHWRHA